MSSIRTYSHTAPYVYTAPYGDIHSVNSPLHYAARLPYAVTSIHLRTANVYHICAYPIILSRVIRVAKMTSRRWLRSSASYYLEVLPHHLSTVSKRAFPVAGANISHLHVTRGLQTASQDFPLLLFLPGHPDITYLLLIIIVFFFLAFPVDLAIIDII